MRFAQELRDPQAARAILERIWRAAAPVRIMEVCGGHTHVICRYNLSSLLPPGITLVHGPGCPVCVIPSGVISAAASLADTPGHLVACFGDVLRLPSPNGTLLSRARGRGTVRMVYSALDVLELARTHPDTQVVFLAIGFETTAPSTGVLLLRAAQQGIPNLKVLSSHFLIPPVLRALVEDPATRVDAFIAPGHVSTVTGAEAYRFLSQDFGCPVVITGFEPLDILQAILMILEQVRRGEPRVEIQYRRAVSPQGNRVAQEVMARALSVADGVWRGLGLIPNSGLVPSHDLAHLDARALVSPGSGDEAPGGCRCGDVLKGILNPRDCPLFGRACTPDDPQGPCMVSPEGACAAYFRYGEGGWNA